MGDNIVNFPQDKDKLSIASFTFPCGSEITIKAPDGVFLRANDCVYLLEDVKLQIMSMLRGKQV
jgi:urease accessory protein UreE